MTSKIESKLNIHMMNIIQSYLLPNRNELIELKLIKNIDFEYKSYRSVDVFNSFKEYLNAVVLHPIETVCYFDDKQKQWIFDLQKAIIIQKRRQ